MNRICLLALGLAGVVGGVPAGAQTPSKVAASYFRVLQEENYELAAGYFEEETLAEFREMLSFLDELPGDLAAGIYPQFFGEGETPESVAAMDDRTYFAHFLGGMMAQAKALGGVSLDRMEILGEVPEGDEVVHVLTRSRASVGEMEIEGMEVISFRRVDEEWKALLSGKMKGMAAQLKAALQQEPAYESEAEPGPESGDAP